MDPLLQLVDVHKRHGGRPVLRGVDLVVGHGEVVGLIGENGVGKSTLIGLLSGAYPVDQGSILLEGEPISVHNQSEAMSHGIGAIRQDLNVNPLLTVAQAVFRTGKRAGLPHGEVRDEAAELMARHGFGLSVDARLKNLSPLERVLVEMARMAVEDARLILMDEVGALFTRPEIDVFHDVLERQCERGVSAIYITHRLSEIKRIASRVAVLKQGRISQVVEADAVSVQDLAAMLLTREQVSLADRTGHARDDLALSVSGLTAGHLRDVELQVRRGEVLGLTGPARRGGMRELASALAVEGTGNAVTLAEAPDGIRPGVAYFSVEDQLAANDSETIAAYLTPDSGSDSEVAALREIIQTIQSLHVRASSAMDELRSLSGGDRQKVALVRRLADAPSVLILDHPTRGLDVRSRQDLYQLISDHTGRGGSIILISADPAELRAWSDRIALMQGGRLVGIVRPTDVDDDDLDVAMVAPPARALEVDDEDEPRDGGARGERYLVG